jgi:hypothetical protein
MFGSCPAAVSCANSDRRSASAYQPTEDVLKTITGLRSELLECINEVERNATRSPLRDTGSSLAGTSHQPPVPAEGSRGMQVRQKQGYWAGVDNFSHLFTSGDQTSCRARKNGQARSHL